MQPINKLENLEEFEQVIKQYHPSDQSVDIFRAVKQVILVGPTASGRNTMINILVDTGRYCMIVSDTTRQKRVNNGALEVNGKEYWFKSEAEFLQGIKQGEYLEAAIIHQQQVSGAHINEYIKANKSGLITIKEIEPNGAEFYHELNPNLLSIFLLPPSFDIWMQRLRGRGQIEEEEIVRRLTSAVEEITTALNKDYYNFVINNEIHEASQVVDELVNGRTPDNSKQQKGRNHALQLIEDVQLFLQKT